VAGRVLQHGLTTTLAGAAAAGRRAPRPARTP
jgi:hypothetical protein